MPIILIVILTTELRSEALLPSLGVALLYMVSGVTRIRLARSFEHTYDQSPRRWRARFAASILLPAMLWGAGCSLILVHFAMSWTYQIVLLTTTGVPASAKSRGHRELGPK